MLKWGCLGKGYKFRKKITVEAVDVAWDHAGDEEDGVDDTVHAWTRYDHSRKGVSFE